MSASIAVVPHAKLRLRPLQLFFNGMFRPQTDPPTKQIRLPASVLQSLLWWIDPANLTVGVPFRPWYPTVILGTNASLLGWGAICSNLRTQGIWSHRACRNHINFLELLAVFKALQSFEDVLLYQVVQAKHAQFLHLFLTGFVFHTTGYLCCIPLNPSRFEKSPQTRIWSWMWVALLVHYQKDHGEKGASLLSAVPVVFTKLIRASRVDDNRVDDRQAQGTKVQFGCQEVLPDRTPRDGMGLQEVAEAPLSHPHDECQLLRPDDVDKVLGQVRPTTCLLDPCPSGLLKKAKDGIGTWILEVVNTSLRDGQVPAPLKEAVVRPVLKKASLNPEVVANYRPVANIPFLGKVLERVVAGQFQAFLDETDYLDPFQSGFRPGYSTESALVTLYDDLCRERDRGSASLLVLVDLSAAFDTINHGILLNRLAGLGVGGTAWRWFHSYLNG
ncbi:RNA-directed DNA polymerase from mobile element jockey [Varanus komodoensis]|nr:RNA-directed DNA polymerase from mobile element jockey [Varanus komodoensis]